MNFPDELPQHLWRFPTRAAQDALAARFDLPNDDWMQDWEYVVPRAEQLNEYLAAYTSGELNDEERFTLMEMMLECLRGDEEAPQRAVTLRLIEENVMLHLKTIWYWACLDPDNNDLEDAFDVAPAMRAILLRHQELWQ